MNERLYDNGSQRLLVPLMTMVGWGWPDGRVIGLQIVFMHQATAIYLCNTDTRADTGADDLLVDETRLIYKHLDL